MRKLSLIAAVAAAVCVACSAQAVRAADTDDFGRGGNGGRFGMFGTQFMRDLNLTAEQKTKLIDAATENFRERLQLRWELEDARANLRELRRSSDADDAALVAANEAMGKVRGKLDVARKNVWKRFEDVLTQEQRDLVEQFRDERAARWESFRDGDNDAGSEYGDDNGDDRDDRRGRRFNRGGRFDRGDRGGRD